MRSIQASWGGGRSLPICTLSRLDRTAPMKRVNLDAGTLVAEVAEQMRPMAESKEVHLEVDTSAPAMVQGEPDKLKQVVLNLVDNAVRYTPAGGEVRLSAATDPATGDVRIEVKDRVPELRLRNPAHFDRFYRGDTSRARATGNTGLGLAIARAIVEAHAGNITIHSTLGEGATFTVTLPGGQPPDRRETLTIRRVGEQGRAEQTTARRVT